MKDVSSAVTLLGLAFVGAGIAAAAGLLSTVKAGIEYDRQVALTKTQTDGFASSLQALGQMGKDVASQIAVPFGEVQSALFDIFSSMTVNMSQAQTLLTAFAKAAVAGQVSIQDSSRSTMGIMNAFKIPVSQVNTVLDKQFQLVRKGVGTYGQFASVIGKVTPSAVRFGQSLDTMDATLIFLTRNGLSTASAAAAAARAFDAMSNPATVGKLEKLGITVRDAKGQFLPFIDILKQMAKYLNGLPPASRAKALFDIFKGSGGTIQAKRLFDLLLPTAKDKGNLDQYEQFLKDMTNSNGQFSAAYSTMADTTAAKTQLLKNNFDIFKTSVGQALEPAFNKLLDFGSKILTAFNKLDPALQRNIAQWALWGAVFSAVTGAVLLVLGLIGMLAGALAALGLSLGTVLGIIALVIIGIAGLGAVIYSAYTRSQNMRDLFASIGKTFSDVWTNDISPFITQMRDGLNRDLVPALHNLYMVVDQNVIPALNDLWQNYGKSLVTGLKEILNWTRAVASQGFKSLSDIINGYLIPAVNNLTTFYYKHKAVIDQLASSITFLAKWIGKLAGSAVMGLLITVLAIVVGGVADAISQFLLFIYAVQRLVGWIKQLYTWISTFASWVFRSMGGVKNAFVSSFNDISNAARDIPNKIRNAVGSLGGVLYSAGRDVINGLINGIEDSLGRLGSILGGVGAFIASHKGPPSYDKVMLRKNGRFIMQGLIRGLNDEKPALANTLQGLNFDTVKTAATAATPAASRSTVLPNSKHGRGKGDVYVTIHTQEIRPEYHSQQLGALLARGA